VLLLLRILLCCSLLLLRLVSDQLDVYQYRFCCWIALFFNQHDCGQ
jgi:hypothetical protein